VKRNLIVVTKVLQNLSNQLFFGDKETHMRVVNPYLQLQMQTMRNFFNRITNVPPLQEFLQADKMLESPEPFVYLTLKEIFYFHKLIKTHAEASIAPTHSIHRVLASLKEVSVPTEHYQQDKYVMVRLVDWLGEAGGSGASSPGAGKQEGLNSLGLYLLPVVKSLASTSIEVEEKGSVYDQIQTLLSLAKDVARENSNAHLAQQIQLVLRN